ncbi:MAG: class I SAM-dependent methyltransferase [Erysipelotrichaceae bacterium]
MSYSQIAKYYSDIFPLSLATLNFLDEAFHPNRSVLDVGCGNGAYANALAKRQYQVSGLEPDEEMIAYASHKAKLDQVEVEWLVGGMQDLTKIFPKESFANIFCIGNTLAHALNESDLKNILTDCYLLLEQEGVLVLQIVNYDRVVSKQLTGLPTIENKEAHLTFERHYKVDYPRVTFHTVLDVNEEHYESTITLYAILHDQLVDLLVALGYRDIQTYGNFNKAPFELHHSQSLVITCKK